jgi:hypothetical protein
MEFFIPKFYGPGASQLRLHNRSSLPEFYVFEVVMNGRKLIICSSKKSLFIEGNFLSRPLFSHLDTWSSLNALGFLEDD